MLSCGVLAATLQIHAFCLHAPRYIDDSFFPSGQQRSGCKRLFPEMLRENARTRRAPWKAKLSCCAVGFGWSTTLSRVVWFAQCTRCSALQCVSLCILSALLFMCKLDHSYFWHTVAKNDQGFRLGYAVLALLLDQRLGRILLFPHCSSMAMSFPNDINYSFLNKLFCRLDCSTTWWHWTIPMGCVLWSEPEGLPLWRYFWFIGCKRS